MKLKDSSAWNKWKAGNTDDYGNACIIFAERWANLMESEMEPSKWKFWKTKKSLEDIARNTSSKADTDGITVFMYGRAVQMLSTCWKYGEELRLWHNLDTQIGKEGEKANESGGVLNPAILNIDTSK